MTLARDLAILVARIGIGAVFIAHGWQKLVTNGVDGTAGFFGSVGIPLPTAAAWFAALLEVGGGVALILGLLTPVVGVLLALNMLGAYVFVHAGNGIFVDAGGAELVLVLGVGALMLAAVGAGRVSVDSLLTPLVRRRTAVTA
ncbi:DoxX family protein [Catenuloplanes japonicus]|uniref:DoxX family protein n=1 Tax=Catenuloplanes japonicus TaxID=33876 RepID=UPI0005262441|nr:DoxX family protein [Catenuloplanes japonicus]